MTWKRIAACGCAIAALSALPVLNSQAQAPQPNAPTPLTEAGTTDTPTKVPPPSAASGGGATGAPASLAERPQPGKIAPANPGEVVGKTLFNLDDKEVAKIDDVVVDPTSGARTAILAYGGFLGIGKHRVTIPFARVVLLNGRPVADIEPESLDYLPEYEPGTARSVLD